MRIATWNISAGYIYEGEKKILMTNYFTMELKKLKPDIICLQNAHVGGSRLADGMSEDLDFDEAKFSLSPSHVNPNFELGLAVMSKNLITESDEYELDNPELEIERKGTLWRTHQKGFLKINTKIDVPVIVMSVQLYPLQLFKKDIMSPQFKELRDEVSHQIVKSNAIVAGTFHTKDLHVAFPRIFDKGYKEVFNEPTTKNGDFCDNILIPKQWTIVGKGIIKGKGKHYLCYVDVEKKI